jgi:hypothetical protein
VPQSEQTLLFAAAGHGSTRVLLDLVGALATVAGVRQIFYYGAYGNTTFPSDTLTNAPVCSNRAPRSILRPQVFR